MLWGEWNDDEKTLIAVVAALAMNASAAKKLIFVGWNTGDLTPAEIVRNAEALYEVGADGVGIYPRFKAEKGARTKRATNTSGSGASIALSSIGRVSTTATGGTTGGAWRPHSMMRCREELVEELPPQ